MSYQVLARKWRPRFFDEMVGQEHVLKALINALNEQRLHHAYLFTGTRGVGKTTIARILAKCLNCEEGISARPCGVCSSCTEIAEGRFVDLIEVDAASRTKVEDTRELLDNVQYAPTRGRFKVYLIDEVHMLSTHSFNALLKTLEEPPAHVKFLLATTDPQKLPVTILSRCLQFSLKNMTPEKIVSYLAQILGAEKLAYEEPALWQLGRAAEGSMRDALSLTDQAIAYGEGHVGEEQVNAMLGTMDRGRVFKLAEVMAKANAGEVMAEVAEMAEHSPDYDEVLQALLHIWHRAALGQVVPDAIENSQGDRDAILTLARYMTPEDVQLYYQIGLSGRKDLALAADPRQGFEMVLLRMLAFRPVSDAPAELDLPSALSSPAILDVAAVSASSDSVEKKKSESFAVIEHDEPSDQPHIPDAEPKLETEIEPEPAPETEPEKVIKASVVDVDAVEEAKPTEPAKPEIIAESDPKIEPKTESAPEPAPELILPELAPHTWWQWVEQLPLGGLVQAIARNSALVRTDNNVYHFDVDPSHAALFNSSHQELVESALRQHQAEARVVMEVQNPRGETPEQRRQREQAEALHHAQQMIESDPVVQQLMSEMDATIVGDSIRPLN